MPNRSQWFALMLISLIGTVSGCARFDGIVHRRDNAKQFTESVEHRTKAVLEAQPTMKLEHCIKAALEHNMTIRAADISAQIATLDRKAVFSNFLPKLSIQYTSTELNNAPASSMLGPFSVQVQDRIVRETTLEAQWPVFAPATWFLYEAFKRGEEISQIVADYTRQMIVLQTAALYFQCLALMKAGEALESQHESAKALLHDVEAFYKEGVAIESDVLRARLLAQARHTDYMRNQNALADTQAELLTLMGLSPLGTLQLDEEGAVMELPEGELKDWIWTALLNNPRLGIADRQVAIEEEKVKIAFTEFLPIVAVFAGRNHTTNSLTTFPYATAFGFSSLMTLFNGFQSVQEYEAARLRRMRAYVNREEETLVIMAEVVRAHLNLENAQLDKQLATINLEAATAALRETTVRFQEGISTASEALEAQAKRDAAEAFVASTSYKEQVAIAVLKTVLGNIYCKEEENHECQ